ncbi:GNAT family N-acetyltransferase [Solibacillus sp. CAU 1738]|uniref:GNAT family N-acetyltransferase n=1 Tax=Solibacillus sp. CAU 1738 TaxID=3140363 RepID=UPI0032611F4E
MEIIHSNDALAIRHVMLQAFSEYADDPQPSSALYETEQTITLDLQRGARAFLGKIDGQPVAMVRFTVNESYLYFYRLSVVPNHQGKGLAKKLLATLEDYAQRNNLSEIQCKVRASVPKNIDLYESVGYEIIANEQSTNPLGMTMNVVTMKKTIN